MNLSELIKKKFMPPFKEDGKLYDSHYIIGYSLKEKEGKYIPFIKDRSLKEKEDYYPTSKYSNRGWSRKKFMYLNEETILFDTPEEAREAAWENFEHNYANEVERVCV